MNKSVHTRRPKGPHDVVRFLRKLWKHRKVLVRAIAFLGWVVRFFDGN